MKKCEIGVTMRQIILLGIIVYLTTQANAEFPGCDPKIKLIIRNETMIQSPGFERGEDYPSNLKCRYIIVAPYGKRIQLSFEHFDLYPSRLCSDDYFQIQELTSVNSSFEPILCDSLNPFDMTSAGRALLVRFRTNYQREARGFSIRVRFAGEHQSKCSENHFECDNHNCVEYSQLCNSINDCGDRSDEDICLFGNTNAFDEELIDELLKKAWIEKREKW